MPSLVIYDSLYGNTEKIAKAVGQGLGGDVSVRRISDIGTVDWNTVPLLIVGAPTQGGRATQAIQDLINNIPANGLKNSNVAAFDTRFLQKDQNFALRMLMKSIGYAADKIAKVLENKGGKLVAAPEGFIVTGKEGPLADGELERATNWAKGLAST